MYHFKLLLTLFIFIAQLHLTASEELSKQDLWNKMDLEVSQWTDSLGKPIDSQIKDTVIVLNLLGIRTSQSCEGHLDGDYPYPWISFEVDNEEITALREEIFSNFQETEKYVSNDPETLKDHLKKQQILWDKLKHISQLQMKPLIHLLHKYYAIHSCSYENTLTLFDQSYAYDLHCMGAEYFLLFSEAEKEAKLVEFQGEMTHFTEFLKKHFFEDIVLNPK